MINLVPACRTENVFTVLWANWVITGFSDELKYFSQTGLANTGTMEFYIEKLEVPRQFSAIPEIPINFTSVYGT